MSWQAELKAMEDVTFDSNRLLSEKLALTREMSSLRPEVEHLRAQVEANQGLLADKLSLQRQMSTLQVELDNEKRTSARTMAKQGKKNEQDEEMRAELEELRKALAQEKKDRLKAEASIAKAEKVAQKVQADLESQQQATERLQTKLDKASSKETIKVAKKAEERDAGMAELENELEKEKTARQNIEETSKQHEADLAELRQELEQAKRENKKAERANSKKPQQNDDQANQLRQELEDEKRERSKAEKEYKKSVADMQSRYNALDDKLSAFREKLRSTKEKIKEKDAEIEALQSATVKPSIEMSKASTNARKRMVTTVEPETNLGTPGDGFPAKKAKRAASVATNAIGDTSNFSLTPFLNRKSSIVLASPIVEEEDEEEEEEEEDAMAGAEHEKTPTAEPKKAAKKPAVPKTKPLAPAASNKRNAKTAARKKATSAALEVVTEEASELSGAHHSAENAPITVPLKDADDGQSRKQKGLVPKIKPRKSLMSFAAFTEEPALEKKKRRKLGEPKSSALGKTLFDDADEDALPAKPTSGKGIFAARALGKSVLGRGPVRPISGGYKMLGDENFSFSPLKKERKSMSILK
jgi:hypothetical protein